MPRRRPPGLALSSYIVAYLSLFPAIAAAQQQHLRQNGYRNPPHEGPLADTFTQNQNTKSTIPQPNLASPNERAVATIPTLAPAESNPAVRAPPARPTTGPSGSLSSRLSARSLQDWEVENFVLLATVDGKLHARDRSTGKTELWTFSPPGEERPMVETIHYRPNRSESDDIIPEDDVTWIVEPKEDGALYVYTPGPNVGIQKLGLTVKQLAEEFSPYASEDPPAVYTAEKKSTLYTLNAKNGRVMKRFSSGALLNSEEDSCKPATGLEALDDDEECTSTGTLIIGQTEYTVNIQNSLTGEPICTIRYFEWTPNNRDRDLHSQYSATMDNKYIYSRHDGGVFALEDTRHSSMQAQRPLYQSKLSSPVVRVYDVARPYDTETNDASLVVLPQPVRTIQLGDNSQNVFINCTESGSWYAMSEARYPTVTLGVSKAQCYDAKWDDDVLEWRGRDLFTPKSAMVGVHTLSTLPDYAGRRRSMPSISGPEPLEPIADPVTVDPAESALPQVPMQRNTPWYLPLQQTWVSALVALVILIAAGGFLNHKIPQRNLHKQTIGIVEAHQASLDVVEPPISNGEPHIPIADDRRVTFAVPEEETAAPDNAVAGTQEDVIVPLNTPIPEPNGEPFKPKKKAHRGQRGGRKRRKSKADTEDPDDDPVGQIVEGVKRIGQEQPLQPDEITVNADGITGVSNVKQINSLIIREDRTLGHGSGGTFVFEGTFEGRDVAVKRMLLEFYELASQEVALLQQSDDHPNVIRYYCQQKDANFLYIAVELCQASLWDLYENDSVSVNLDEDRKTSLIYQINQDVPRALYQLAAGLNHLHSLRIIHRDIKPQNILIAYPKKNQTTGPRFVISDFGLCKTLPENMSTLRGTTGIAGTVGWKAPELILQPKDADGRQSSSGPNGDSSSTSEAVAQGVKRAVDVFSLGCVFFYVLTNGSHPFDDDEGWMQVRELNIKKNKYNFSKLESLGDDCEEPISLISWMLNPKPELRPTAHQVMNHPFFWPPEKRLEFLCDVSDHWEREVRDPPSQHLQALESHGPIVIGRRGDFLEKLDRKFVDTLGKQRKYTGDRMLDLLRALRNKKNHYADIPPDVQEKVGKLPTGYLRYWTTRFPKLLMACYNAVTECGLQDESRFERYFKAS